MITIVNEKQDQVAVAERVILKENPLNKMQRITELLVDWLMICLYLIVIFLIVAMFNFFVHGTAFPNYSETTSLLILTFTTTVPIALVFAWMEYRFNGTLGKVFSGLVVVSTTRSFGRFLLRNLIKFVPWQLGLMAVTRFMYHEPDTLAFGKWILSTGLMLMLIIMSFRRKDKRHLADLMVGTQVQSKD